MRTLLVVTLLLGSTGVAAAQEDGSSEGGDPSRDDEARALFFAGASAYDGGRFEEALDYFQRSYQLSGRPGLLYNIASAAERARRDELALRSYEEYLRLAPDAENRARVETRIEALRRLLEERDESPASETANETTASPDAEVRGDPGPLPWVLVAGGGALAAAGAILLGVGLADQATVEDPPQGARWEDAEAAYERGPALLTSGAVLLPVGLATVGAGLVLALIPIGGDGDEAGSASLRVGPGTLTVRGRF